MPRVEFSIPIAGSDCRIGLWKMTESEEELYAGVPELIRYRHVVCNMKSSARRLEFLCVRSLLMDMMGGMHEIIHNSDGKPYLECGKNISISHTRGYVAVILSDNSDVAIDIEYMDERVCRIADRFLRDDEKTDETIEKLLSWCAKESLYKLYSQDKLVFHEMKISGLCGLSDLDSRYFYIENLKRRHCVKMFFVANEAFVLTYAIEKVDKYSKNIV